MISKRFKRQNGFSLIETVVVLTIVGLIIAGLWLAYSNATKERRLADSKQQIVTIVSNAKDFASGRNMFVAAADATVANLASSEANAMGFWGFDEGSANGRGIFPAGLCGGTPFACRGPYAGNSYTASLVNGGNGRYELVLHAIGLPQDACLHLGTVFNDEVNYIGVANAGVVPTQKTVGGTPGVDGTDITPLCAGAANDLFFRFRL